jgi:hypothetical protein
MSEVVNAVEEDVEVYYDHEQPGNTLARMAERDQQRHRQDYEPVEERLIESLRDTSIVDSAADRVTNNSTADISRGLQRNSRDAKRLGFRRTNADNVSSLYDMQRGQAKDNAGTMNNARLNQFDRNRDLRNKLINVGRGVADQGMDGLGAAADNEAARDTAYDRAKTDASNANTQAGASLISTAIMYAAFTASDERIKDNVETIDSALDKVARLRGVYFTRNDLTEEENAVRRTGVIAQEVREVLPEVVVQTDREVEGVGPILAVEYGAMVGVLIEAVKELQDQIQELREG